MAQYCGEKIYYKPGDAHAQFHLEHQCGWAVHAQFTPGPGRAGHAHTRDWAACAQLEPGLELRTAGASGPGSSPVATRWLMCCRLALGRRLEVENSWCKNTLCKKDLSW